MTDILVPAIVTAAATLASGSLSSLVTWRAAKRKEREQRDGREAGTTASFRAITDALAQFYGVKAQRVVSSMAIMDLTGLCHFTKTIGAIQITSDAVFRSIPLPVEALATAKCVREPELTFFEFSRPGSLRKGGGTGSYFEYALDITGGLTKADGPLSFSHESEWRDTFLMTKEEVAEAYREASFKHEYLAASILFPVEESLEVSVSFPEGYPAKCHPAVFPKASEELHLGELERTKAGFQPNATGARFHIKEPLIGFLYAIYWESPPAAVVGALASTSGRA